MRPNVTIEIFTAPDSDVGSTLRGCRHTSLYFRASGAVECLWCGAQLRPGEAPQPEATKPPEKP